MFSFLIKTASFKKTFMTTQNGFCQQEITKGLSPTKVPHSSPKKAPSWWQTEGGHTWQEVRKFDLAQPLAPNNTKVIKMRFRNLSIKWNFSTHLYLWSSARCHWVLRRLPNFPSPPSFHLGYVWRFYKTGSSDVGLRLSSAAFPLLVCSGTTPDRENHRNSSSMHYKWRSKGRKCKISESRWSFYLHHPHVQPRLRGQLLSDMACWLRRVFVGTFESL